jgi:hypothetical protein
MRTESLDGSIVEPIIAAEDRDPTTGVDEDHRY